MTATRKGATPGPDTKGKSPKDKGKLTPKQLRFADEYPKDFNAAAAAVRAGYSKKGAKQTGHYLLTNPDLQAAIQAVQRQDAVAAGIERQKLINLAYRAATFDPRKLFRREEVPFQDATGRAPGPTDPATLPAGKSTFIDPSDWPDDVAGIMTVQVTARGPVFQPRVSSIDGLEFCMKYAMFEDGSDPNAKAPHEEEIAKRVAERLAARRAAT